MINRTRWLMVALIVVLLLATTVSGALAQDGSGDKIVLAENWVLRSGEQLDGNLTVMGGNATLEAESVVTGDVLVMGGSLSAAGAIDGDVKVWGGSVTLLDGADVAGDLATFGGSLDRRPGARVGGRVQEGFGVPTLPRVRPPVLRDRTFQEEGPLDAVGRFVGWQVGTVVWALFMALLAVGAVLLAPRRVQMVAGTAAREPGVSLLAGLVTFVVAAMGGGVLLIACGLGLLVWLGLALAVLLGWIAVGLWFGQRLLDALRVHSATAIGEVALGVLIITVAARIPCLGALFGIVVGSLGLGAVVLTRAGSQPYAPGGSFGRSLEPLAPRGPIAPASPEAGPTSDAPRGTPAPAEDWFSETGPRAADDFVPDPPGLHVLAPAVEESRGPESPVTASTPTDTDTSAGNTESAAADLVPDPPVTRSEVDWMREASPIGEPAADDVPLGSRSEAMIAQTPLPTVPEVPADGSDQEPPASV